MIDYGRILLFICDFLYCLKISRWTYFYIKKKLEMKLLHDRAIESKNKYNYLSFFFFLISGEIRRAILSLNAQVLLCHYCYAYKGFSPFIRKELKFMQANLYKWEFSIKVCVHQTKRKMWTFRSQTKQEL